MSDSEPITDPSTRLDSWKAIAEYLGRDRTTVIRWERQAGLPVRRVAGTRGRSVFAYKSEIDRWLAAQTNGIAKPESAAVPLGEEPIVIRANRGAWFQQWLFVSTVVLVAVAGVSYLFARHRASATTVATASLIGTRLVGFGADGRQLWAHELPRVEGAVTTSGIAISDLDDDGRPEIVAALCFRLRNGGEGYGQVLVLDDRGGTRWQRTLDDSFRFGDLEFGPAWFPDDLLVYRSGGEVRVAVTAHHHTWWPAVVETYDREGESVGKFVNAGWINALNAVADGKHLLVAGVNNSFGGAVLAVLDGKNPAGASPSAGGRLPACVACPAGTPRHYFVSPWTDLARPSEVPYSGVVQILADGAIEWRAAQRPAERDKVPEVIVLLSPRFEVIRRAVDDYFAETHARLERDGQIPRLSDDWRRPIVREWTPDAGWRDVR